MEEIKFCPHCGHPNKGINQFCEKCGQPLENSIPSQRIQLDDFVNEDSLNRNPFKTRDDNFDDSHPEVEKTNYHSMNYSQSLRTMLFVNPIPLYIGLVFMLILACDVFIPYFINQKFSTFSIIGIILFFVNLISLFKYLIIDPLASMHNYKQCQIDYYKISFFKDRLHYQMNIIIKGQEMRNDFYLMYADLFKFKEYKDMAILGFVIQGQLIPMAVIKDEYYDSILALLQNRIKEIKGKK